MKREFHYRWVWRLRANPEALWPLVSDTNRFDRDAGLPMVERVARPGEVGRTAGHRVRTRIAGLLIEWDEKPFEWVRPERFGVVREYLAGPIKRLRVLVTLKPDGAGTELRYEVWSEPRNFLGVLVIPIQAGIIARRRFGEAFQRYDAAVLQTPAVEIVAAPAVKVPELSPGGSQRLTVATSALVAAGISKPLVDSLGRLVREADDLELSHIRPYACADRWKMARPRVLEAFLRATRAGILDLQWDLLCPLCRGVQETAPSLSGIRPQVHCESCHIDFATNFERAVELTFRPNPAIREVAVREYCVGGPGSTPHVFAQQVLESGARREVVLGLEPGRYSIRCASFNGLRYFAAHASGAERMDVEIDGATWPGDEPVVGRRVTLNFHNSSAAEQCVIVSRLEWTDQAVMAAEVTALQVFRDLFSGEALRPGEQISVGQLAVLFTDLRDSTQLYRDIGDAPAFGRVMSHFDVLRAAIAAEQGAVVKTIGDAVMAVFRRPVGAIRAVLSAQRRLAEMGAPPLTLKAGIHLGPCIAVTLNDRLDYFGSTVNFAARIQRLSAGDDVVISHDLRNDPEVLGHLATLNAERFVSEIKGFAESGFHLWRVRPS